MYAKTLPQFRTALLFQIAHQATGLVIAFPLLFVRSKTAIIVLASLVMALDILLRSAQPSTGNPVALLIRISKAIPLLFIGSSSRTRLQKKPKRR